MFKEILGEAFPIIQKVAPVIAGAVGSPVAGAAAMLGVNLVANAFGISNRDIHKLGDAILSNPDADNRLTELEGSFGHMLKTYPQDINLSGIEGTFKVTFK